MKHDLQLHDHIILSNGNELVVQSSPDKTIDGTLVVSCFSYDGDYEWDYIELDSPDISQIWRNKVLIYSATPPPASEPADGEA